MKKFQLIAMTPVLTYLLSACMTTHHTYVSLPPGTELMVTPETSLVVSSRRGRVVRNVVGSDELPPAAAEPLLAGRSVGNEGAGGDLGSSGEPTVELPVAVRPMAERAEEEEPFGERFWAGLLKAAVLACIPVHC